METINFTQKSIKVALLGFCHPVRRIRVTKPGSGVTFALTWDMWVDSSCGMGQRQFRQPQKMSNALSRQLHADAQHWFLLALISRSSLRVAQAPHTNLGRKDWDFEGGCQLGHGATMVDPGVGPLAVLPFMTCVGVLGLEFTWSWASHLSG